MIYLLYGGNTDKARTKLHELVASLVKKKPDASHVRMNDETFEPATLEEYVGGMGLFSQKMIVEVDNVFRNKEAKETILERVKEISESENIFVFLEEDLTKADLKKFEKYSEKIQEFEEKDEIDLASKKFNVFSLTDAFGRRDKKQLWVLYTKAKMKDVSAEEIHGILFWQIKAMLVASQTQTPEASGLNPFVFQKSSGFIKNFKTSELQKISSDLVSMYHNTRRGIVDFDSALEKFVLEV